MRLKEEMPKLDGIAPCLNEAPLYYEEKPTLIHVWSISCNDCKKQLPFINKIKNEFKNELHVVSIHMPRTKDDLNVSEIEKVIHQFELTEPILLDNEYILTNTLRTRYVPSYYLFDREKKLRFFQSSKGWRLLRNRISRLLNE